MVLNDSRLKACNVLRQLLNGETLKFYGVDVKWFNEDATYEEDGKIKRADKSGIYKNIPVVTPKRQHKYNKWVFIEISVDEFVEMCKLS
jgi:hypothetical protein